MPAGIEAISRAARLVKPDAIVWRGDEELPLAQQGIRVLGAHIGRTEFVVAHLEGKDTQACWLLLLMCELLASNGQTRRDEKFCRTSRWVGLGMLERCSGNTLCASVSKGHCQLAIVHGALEVRTAAFWASWADSMKMVKERHPTIANEMMVGIDREEGPCFQSVRTCQQLLVNAGFVVPPWPELVDTPPRAELEPEPNQPKFGYSTSTGGRRCREL